MEPHSDMSGTSNDVGLRRWGYPKEFGEIRSTGAGVAETFYYHAPPNLPNEIGRTLTDTPRDTVPLGRDYSFDKDCILV